MNYHDYIDWYKASHHTVPPCVWKWFDFDEMIVDRWAYGELEIVYDDGVRVRNLNLNDLEKQFPVWKGRTGEYLKGHPVKEHFYITELTTEPSIVSNGQRCYSSH